MKQIIYIGSYPKSGSSWLAWLLGDALNCPVGGSSPGDNKGSFPEGQDRPGNYEVRKGHFVLVDTEGSPIVPQPHQLAWKNLTTEHVIFIVRDPRDIVVSAKFYRGKDSMKTTLNKVCSGKLYGLPSWSEYVERWLDRKFTFTLIHYEELLANTESEIRWILDGLGLPTDRATFAVQHQDFIVRKRETKNSKWHQKLMRKGMTGDWRNHFDAEMTNRAWECFGPTMQKLGYGRN